MQLGDEKFVASSILAELEKAVDRGSHPSVSPTRTQMGVQILNAT